MTISEKPGVDGYPRGDNDGNTQGVPGSEEQDFYELALQYFADGVYESTEGAHRIGTVHIFKNGVGATKASILWTASNGGTPAVPYKGGINVTGGHINMFDIAEWYDKNGKVTAQFNMLSNAEAAGYTLAHEWGHYCYGVYDEYGPPTFPNDKAVKKSMMNSQWNAMGGNYDWLNFSVAWRQDPALDWEDTKRTRQHNMHSASCWETLARPTSEDTRSGDALTIGPRTYYEEMTRVCPVLMWTASVTQGGDWLYILSGSRGSESGTITTAYLPNLSLYSRTARVTVRSKNGLEQSVNLVQKPFGGIKLAEGPTKSANPPGLQLTADSAPVSPPPGFFVINVSNTNSGKPVHQMPSSNARADLNIVWQQESLVYEIALDASPSMFGDCPDPECNDPNKIVYAKQAAKLLVDKATIGSSLGVVAFGNIAQVVTPVQQILDETTKANVKRQIDNITMINNTAIGTGAQLALNEILDHSSDSNTRAVFLLSDGHSYVGVAPESVVPAYQQAAIPLFTFAYGSDADQTTLRNMAVQTGGEFHYSPTTLEAVTGAFNHAYSFAAAEETLGAGSVKVSPVGNTDHFYVDNSLSRIDVTVVHAGSADAAEVRLVDPSGYVHFPKSSDSTSTGTVLLFNVTSPVSGDWYIWSHTYSGLVQMDETITAVPHSLTYSLSLNCTTGAAVTYPKPILVSATLEQGLPIANAVLNSTVTAPDGTQTMIDLKDDGMPPDAIASDGTYSGQLIYTQDGTYTVSVLADNSKGKAVLTYAGALMSVPPDGSAFEIPPPTPIGEQFQRAEKMTIDVTGVVADDHGNAPSTATELSTENTDEPGRIDYAGDVDYFQINTPAGIGNITVRVSNFAGNIEPNVDVFDSDGTTLLKTANRKDSVSINGYILIDLAVAPYQIVYVAVSNLLADMGTYNIGAGEALAGDVLFEAPHARFTASVTRGTAPLTISFNDNSSGGTEPIISYDWDFGDGSSATGSTATHTYNQKGTYVVLLTIHTERSKDTVTSTIEVAAPAGCIGDRSIHDWRLYVGDAILIMACILILRVFRGRTLRQ